MADEPITHLPCPWCEQPIQVEGVDWRCPCCGTTQDWNLVVACTGCGFSQFWTTCPACRREFEMMLLLGRYRDEAGRTLPADPRPPVDDRQPHLLRTAPVLLAGDVKQDPSARHVALDVLERAADLSFGFPYPFMGLYVVYACHDTQGRQWVQVQIIGQQPEANDPRVGQLVLSATAGDDSPSRLVLVEAFPAAARQPEPG